MNDAASPSATAPTAAPSAPPASPPAAPQHAAPPPKPKTKRRWLGPTIGAVALIALAVWLGPSLIDSIGTASTDDAYVNGHATFVAARVPGQVAKVLVDDNNPVRAGDLLVQLDKEPYELNLRVAEAAVEAAKTDVALAFAQARGYEGQMRSARFALQRSIEEVDNQVALLRSRVANLQVQRSTLSSAQADYERVATADRGTISAEEVDHRRLAVQSAQSQVELALQQVFQARVSLGLPIDANKTTAADLTQVPADIDEMYSGIRLAQANLFQAAAQIGYTQPFSYTPKQMITEFYKQDPEGNLDRIYENLLQNAPTVKQAQSKLTQAERALDQARLNLRYCDVVAEIDGVVVRRAVNPGNNVVAGQDLMVVRSVKEVWIDANFKETQLSKMRIGQPVDIEVDMYGSTRSFKGRVSGFAAGTGSTLALLPPQNATGNFVKVVQRLPVRIDLVDYDAAKSPLFIGLSVTPKVRLRADPTGPDAGAVLQQTPVSSPVPKPTVANPGAKP